MVKTLLPDLVTDIASKNKMMAPYPLKGNFITFVFYKIIQHTSNLNSPLGVGGSLITL